MKDMEKKKRKDLIPIAILAIGIILIGYSIFQEATLFSLKNQLNTVQSNFSTFKTVYSTLLNQSNAEQAGYEKNLSSLKSKYIWTIGQLNYSLNNISAQYNSLVNKIQNPDIINLASNETFIVPKRTLSIPFYNYTYGYYNYTVSGNYYLNFTAPYDGYLLLYLNTTSAHNGTYDFQVASNTSRIFFYKVPYHPEIITLPCFYNCPPSYLPYPATSGYTEAPNTTQALFIIPVMRGKASFEIQNGNPYAIDVIFSLQYVGEPFANYTINKNYT